MSPSTFALGRRRLLQGATALGFAVLGVFPAARKAYADGYEIWEGACPSYATDHDCSPGCGPSPIFGAACETAGEHLGFHRNDGVDWTLRPNECYAGTYDGWLWRYDGPCGACACHVERRCHDGYRRTESGWVRSICRWNTDCGCPGSVDWPLTVPGDVGPDVDAIQQLLTARGFEVDPSGEFDPETTAQVEAFQADTGITVDGRVGAETWALLVLTVREDDTGAAVGAVQHQLVKHGYRIAVDEVAGALTVGAITDFQRQHDLAVDGIAGQQTWRTLTGAPA